VVEVLVAVTVIWGAVNQAALVVVLQIHFQPLVEVDN
jgi:hypothetical protein